MNTALVQVRRPHPHQTVEAKDVYLEQQRVVDILCVECQNLLAVSHLRSWPRVNVFKHLQHWECRNQTISIVNTFNLFE